MKSTGDPTTDFLHAGPFPHVGNLLVEQVEGHDHLGARVPDEGLDLPLDRGRRDRRKSSAQAERAEVDDRKVRRVRHEKEHHVALFDSCLGEGGGHASRFAVNLSIRDGPIQKNEGWPVAVTRDHVFQRIPDRLVRIGEGRRRVGRIAFQPGPGVVDKCLPRRIWLSRLHRSSPYEL
jgi:hypothetical protein